MKQQQLSFAGQGHTVTVMVVDRPWIQVTDTIRVKEQPLIHSRQSGPTCAYHALATLMGMPPAKVLECGRQVLAESRLRKLSGTHDMLVEVYRRMGYRFPFHEVRQTEAIRADRIETSYFRGKGLLRVTARPKTGTGHLVAYKAGIIYDSALSSESAAEEYLHMLRRRGHRYIRVIPEEHMIRDGNKLSDREREAQEYLKKRPRRSRRRYQWTY